jgi:ADP-ribosylglycohydrolase
MIVNFRVPKDLWERFKVKCVQNKMTPSECLRRAIVCVLNSDYYNEYVVKNIRGGGNFSIIADTELAYRIREFAEKHGIYISDTVRLAIWYYLTMPNQSQC